MIQAVKGSAARNVACPLVGRLRPSQHSEASPTPTVALATFNVLTTIAQYDSFLPTTPSTPIHDAHQEGYSFIEVASRLIQSERSYQ